MKSFTRGILSMALAIVLVIAAVSGAVWFLFIRSPMVAAEKAGREMVETIGKALQFQPQLVSNGVTLIKEKGSINELSIIDRKFTHEHSREISWMGSTKKLRLRGHFKAKAGYVVGGNELVNPFTIEIAPDGSSLTAIIPPPRLHSVELERIEVLEDEDGFWNKIQKQDREEANNALLREARGSIERSGILEEVNTEMRLRLVETVRKVQPTIDVRFLPPL